MKTIDLLFETGMSQWGLRGDPYLWEEMRVYFRGTPMPKTAVSLQSLIEETFVSLSGHPFPTKANLAPIPIKRFDHGGMSSGLISPDFWRDEALPHLIEQFNKNRGTYAFHQH